MVEEEFHMSCSWFLFSFYGLRRRDVEEADLERLPNAVKYGWVSDDGLGVPSYFEDFERLDEISWINNFIGRWQVKTPGERMKVCNKLKGCCFISCDIRF